MILKSVFAISNGAALIFLAKIYHSQSQISDSVIVSTLALCLANSGFLASSTFFQRLIFLLGILLFPINVLSSFAFQTIQFTNLTPLGGLLCILGWFSLIIFNKL